MSSRRAVLFWIAFLTFLPGQALHGDPPQPPAPVRTDHYGDPLPKGARFRLGTVRLRHDGPVTAVGWMSDGRLLASTGEDWTVRLWQIPSGKQIAKWEDARFLVFSADGRTLAYTGIFDKAVHCIDVASRKELRKIPLADWDCSAALSPDGKILATTEGEGIRLYAVDTGKKLRFLEGKSTSYRAIPLLMFSPDGRDLIGMTEHGVCCWNTRTGAKQFPRNNDWRDPLALSPDGKMLADTTGGAVTLRSWPAGEELRRIKSKDHGFWALAFSPDSKILATSERGSIRLWDLATGRQLHRCNERWPSWSLAFSPDGSLLASAGQDGDIKVWELRSGKEPRLLPVVRHRLEFLGLASDGQTLLTRSTDDVLSVWDVRDGRRLRTQEDGIDRIDSFLLGPDLSRKRAVLRQELLKRWLHPGSSEESSSYYSYPAFSPDNTLLAIARVQDGRILLVHKTAQGIESRVLTDENRAKKELAKGIDIVVTALTFSPDGQILAATYSDGSLILWDPRLGRPRYVRSFPRHGESYRNMEFSPDGRLLALSDRSALYVVETASGQPFWKRPLGEHWIDSLAFAPDNRTLAIGDAGQLATIHL